MKTGEYWGFTATGKHPAARDFVRAGRSSPLTESFTRWVEEGYRAVSASQKKDGGSTYAWRFWAKGAKKDALVCGVVKDSSDGLGRIYPLLLMGTGPLPGWEDAWELLPLACHETWSQIEFLTAQRFDDFAKLEKGVRGIRQPESDWAALKSAKEQMLNAGKAFGHESAPSRIEEGRTHRVSGLSNTAEVCISLENASPEDLATAISDWHQRFKDQVTAVPSATFIGGTAFKSYVAFFRRPLVSADFVRLWTIDCAEVKGDKPSVPG